MAQRCRTLRRRIEETVQMPVERVITRRIRTCRQSTCRFLCLNKLFCWLTVILLTVVVWVTVVVVKWITVIVCETASAIISMILEAFRYLLCFLFGKRPNPPSLDDAKARDMVRICEMTYQDPGQSPFSQTSFERLANDLIVENFIDESIPGLVRTQLYILRSPSDRRVVVSFRGSEDFEDWLNDFTLNPKPYTRAGLAYVFCGFRFAYEAVRDQVIARVLTLLEDHQIDELAVTGHSLGGALATLCAHDLEIEVGQSNVTCYTFGAPRVGGSVFVADFDDLIRESFRFVTHGDIVPTLPPSIPFGYRHGGVLVYLRGNDPLVVAPCPAPPVELRRRGAHQLITYRRGIFV